MENTSNENTTNRFLEFNFLPMPPSINKTLTSVRGRLIKTSIARLFERQVRSYFVTMSAQQKRSVEIFKEELSSKRPKDRKICFEVRFYFPQSDIFCLPKTKSEEIGEPKRKDTSNRIKPLEDRISENIGIDDKHFFFVWASKHTMPRDQSLIQYPDGHCSVRLSFIPSTE
jgi:Holliday junction resolvase RusA-like endonuclease